MLLLVSLFVFLLVVEMCLRVFVEAVICFLALGGLVLTAICYDIFGI